MECLEAASVIWMQDFSSIDIDHDGILEVCGVSSPESATKIRNLIAASFTGLSFDIWYKDYGLEIGWIVEAHFPQEQIQ